MVERFEYKQWEPKLKPMACPFCGKTPKILPECPEEDGDAWGEVACVNKKCAVQPVCKDGCTVSDMRGPGRYKDIAILRWNFRAEP
jgi:hypothetical protein